jgi:hypothetical protein
VAKRMPLHPEPIENRHKGSTHTTGNREQVLVTSSQNDRRTAPGAGSRLEKKLDNDRYAQLHPRCRWYRLSVHVCVSSPTPPKSTFSTFDQVPGRTPPGNVGAITYNFGPSSNSMIHSRNPFEFLE